MLRMHIYHGNGVSEGKFAQNSQNNIKNGQPDTISQCTFDAYYYYANDVSHGNAIVIVHVLIRIR